MTLRILLALLLLPCVAWGQGVSGGAPGWTAPTAAVVVSPATSIYLNPTVQAASYAVGTDIGGVLQFTGATRTGYTTGMVQQVTVAWTGGITPSVDLVLFPSNPNNSGTTISDRVALALGAIDKANTIGIIHITDCSSLGTPSLCQSGPIAYEFQLASGTTLYGALVQRTSAGVTPGSTTDLTVSIKVIQQ